MPRANAVRAPATRDQADAYRYGLRRLEAALVRGDPVPLHEQIRAQRRAALAGVALGLLALCGALVYAKLVPSPDWRRQSVVMGSSSGALYVVARHPDRLVPVANLPAARLVLAALRAGGAEADPATTKPVAVPDAKLDAAPRTPAAAVAGAVAVRPDAAVAPHWAVCDEVGADGVLGGTTVIGGAAATPATPAGDGVLLGSSDGATWLVTGGHRHRVDTGDGALLAAYGLTSLVPRAAADALVSLLPEGPPLDTPEVPRHGEPAPHGLPGRIGDVLVLHPVGGPPRYVVVLAGGLQEVPEVLAQLLRVASGAREPRSVGVEVLAGSKFVDDLPVDGWPAGSPRMVDLADAPVLCWTWAGGGDPGGAVWTGTALPLAPGIAPVALAQADGPGARVDAVAVGGGGAVRATRAGQEPGGGPIWLVSATGVAHGVADDATAAALGVGGAEPAPEGALRLLPVGPVLDLGAADRVVDVP